MSLCCDPSRWEMRSIGEQAVVQSTTLASLTSACVTQWVARALLSPEYGPQMFRSAQLGN